MRNLGIPIIAVLLLAAAFALADELPVEIENLLRLEIHELYLRPAGNESWSADQLGDEILAPGDSLFIYGAPCGDYDLRLVDADGGECILYKQRLCNDDSRWTITDQRLLHCEGWID